ncbi:MAG: excinuclease ABC subunit C [Bacteroidetes bacterium]|nr:excinuclease ABC subunit C [Bacteroidota bacterium]
MAASSDNIRETLELLPDQPGVYKYFDSEKNIIYVGKAKSLKKRVSSYFNKIRHENRKTSVLVSKIAHIDFTVVDTEMDALLLENSLIKEFQPRYNVNLKDDKSYPFIRITNERFPKVFAMRNPVKDGSDYFGPYASPKVMHVVLDLIKKLYPTRNCNLNLSEENILQKKFKICLEYQIGNCKGPCEGLQSEEDYNQSIQQIKHLLRGNLAEVRRHLKELMQKSAAELQFEQAQQLKEKLDMLERFQHKSTVVSHHVGNVDVYCISGNEKAAFVNFMRVSQGLVVVSRNLEYRKKLDETDADILELAIGETRTLYGFDTKSEVILPFEIELDDPDFHYTIPAAGEKKKLLELSLKNAMLYKREKMDQYEKLNPDVRIDRVMEQMKNDLRLTAQPRHIECFDNSNFQGTYPVSACVVFKDGKAAKSEYRHFNVKTVEGPDDFATMKEVLTRRYSRFLEENRELPQLVVVDGGKGQLSAAVEAFKEMHIYGKVAVIGIAKRLEELFYPDDPLPLYIDKKSETLKIIQQMRDEAHRFGITHHRKRRDKGTLKTVLTEIDGIGENTANQLLSHFKSMKKVEIATEEELSTIIGKSKAEKVRHFFETKIKES